MFSGDLTGGHASKLEISVEAPKSSPVNSIANHSN
jgi:hypothetical protein